MDKTIRYPNLYELRVKQKTNAIGFVSRIAQTVFRFIFALKKNTFHFISMYCFAAAAADAPGSGRLRLHLK